MNNDLRRLGMQALCIIHVRGLAKKGINLKDKRDTSLDKSDTAIPTIGPNDI